MTGTITFQYDEVRLGRWIERKVEAAGIRAIVGAVVTGVDVRGSAACNPSSSRRGLDPSASRRTGSWTHRATRALSYESGLDVREPDSPVYGSLNFLIEGYDTEAAKDLVIKDVHERLAAARRRLRPRAARRLPDALPRPRLHAGQRHALRDAARSAADRPHGGRRARSGRQRRPFPPRRVSEDLRERADPHVRQPRHPADALDRRPPSARRSTTSARAAVPPTPPPAAPGGSSCTTRRIWSTGRSSSRTTSTTSRSAAWSRHGADNIVTAGRCVDGDVEALSAIRVMGPCIAMGAAAAHALDLAGSGSVHADRPERVPAAPARQPRSTRLNSAFGTSRRHEVTRRIYLYKIAYS